MDKQYRSIDQALPSLAGLVLQEGQELGSRAGRVFETMHNHIVLEQPWLREVLVPGRKASLPAQIAETMWVLAGRSDIEFLSHYLPRAADFSDDGIVWRGGYGPRIRGGIDQLKQVINLLRKDPTSRRAVIAIFDGQEDWVDSKDIPCNDLLVFSSRLGYLDLSVHVRSNDLVWGFSGINQFEWSALQEIVAGILGLQVGSTHYHTVSLHIYDRHWGKAREWANTVSYSGSTESPRFRAYGMWETDPFADHAIDALDGLIDEWFRIEGFIRSGELKGHALEHKIKFFPEPMLQSWLRVIATWWTRDESFMQPLVGTRLAEALAYSPQGTRPDPVNVSPVEPVAPEAVAVSAPFKLAEELSVLHSEKSAAYGDSWKRRGELLGILANVARKIDRLGVTDGNETATDTAADLLVYLVKYRLWLEASDEGQFDDSDEPRAVERRLEALARTRVFRISVETHERKLRDDFERLFICVQQGDRRTVKQLALEMESVAWRLAYTLWSAEQQPVNPGNPYWNIGSTADM